MSENQSEETKIKLTELDKAAIRRYVIKLFTVPAVLVTGIFGLVGYLVGNVGTAKAYQDSYREAMAKSQDAYQSSWNSIQTGILAASANTATVVANAEQAQSELEDLFQQTKLLGQDLKQELENARTLYAELSQINRLEEYKQDIEKIAEIISADDEFKQLLITQALKEIEKLERRLSGIRIVAKDGGKSPGFGCGTFQKEDPTNLKVMYGSLDGTSCGVPNVNFYKEFALVIPD